MKKIVLLSILILMVTSSAMAEGNARKGKYLFKKSCKLCHGKEMAPLTKTMAQWDHYFQEEASTHPGDGFKNNSEGDLKDINQFLHDGASDALSPMSCY